MLDLEAELLEEQRGAAAKVLYQIKQAIDARSGKANKGHPAAARPRGYGGRPTRPEVEPHFDNAYDAAGNANNRMMAGHLGKFVNEQHSQEVSAKARERAERKAKKADRDYNGWDAANGKGPVETRLEGFGVVLGLVFGLSISSSVAE